MFTRFHRATVVIGLTCAIGLAPLSGGCSNLPGNKGTQGAVIGGLGGAAAGALIGKKNRGIGALIGAAIGAGGGSDASGARRPRKAWLPRVSKVLVLQLTDCYQGLSQRMGHPELGAWLLRVSSDARRKIVQAHARMTHPSDKPRA